MLLLTARIGLAAPVVPAEALQALQSGRPADLIVEFDATQVNSAARAQRRAGDLHDTPSILAYRAKGYRQIKDDIEAALPGMPTETLAEYSHLPMRFKRFRSLAALNAWVADSRVKALYANGQLHRVLTNSLPLIQEPVVAGVGYAGAGTTVVVIDDGISYANAAFGGCTAPGAPASCKVVVSQLAGSATGSTDNSHGTHVSAIVLGVAPGAQIAALDAFSGSGAYFSDVVAGINWAIANRSTYNIVGINMSLGDGVKNTSVCTSGNLFVTPVANANAAGITVVAAAGNEGYTNAMGRPACTPGVVSVGAVYSTGYGSLSWGGSSPCTDSATAADKVTCFSDSASFLTLLAPGAMITAAGMQKSGTSQASPHVAGAVAVLRAAFPGESLATTLGRLTTNGVPVTDSRNGLVKPRLNLLAAARPGNDAFAARTAIAGGSGATSGTNLLGSVEAGEPALAANAGGRTVWWKWVAPAAGQVSLNTHGSGFDTVLAVFPAAGGVAALGTAIAANDNDGSPNGASGVLFQAAAGSEYEIAVDGAAGAQGAVALNWSLNTAAAADLSVSLNGPASNVVGVNAAYTVAVRNAGPQTATNVRLTVVLPANVTFVSSSVPCTAGSGSVTCNLGTMDANATLPVTLTVVWTSEGSGNLSATVSSDVTDTAAANNAGALAISSLPDSGGDVPTLPEWGMLVLAATMLLSMRGRSA